MQQIGHQPYERNIFVVRVVLAIIVIIILSLILLANLVSLQIYHHQYYLDEAEGNRYSIAVSPPKRGKIFDRNGQLLADNKLSFALDPSLRKK